MPSNDNYQKPNSLPLIGLLFAIDVIMALNGIDSEPMGVSYFRALFIISNSLPTRPNRPYENMANHINYTQENIVTTQVTAASLLYIISHLRNDGIRIQLPLIARPMLDLLCSELAYSGFIHPAQVAAQINPTQVTSSLYHRAKEGLKQAVNYVTDCKESLKQAVNAITDADNILGDSMFTRKQRKP